MERELYDHDGTFLGAFTQPTQSDVHIDAAMTNLSIAYRNPSYIADMIFPTVNVVKISDYYYIYQMGDWFRDEARARAPGDTNRTIGYKLSSSTYSMIQYGIGNKIPDEVKENADDALAPSRDAVDLVTEKMFLRKEVLVGAMVMTVGNWTYDKDVNGLWADPATSSFVQDIKAGMQEIKNGSGLRPNTLIIDDNTFDTYLTESERVRDQIKHVTDDVITTGMLATFFGLDRVLLGSAMKTTAIEKKTEVTVALQNIWEVNAGKGSAWLGYVARSPGLKQPSAGYIFQKGSRIIERTRGTDREKSDYVDAYETYDEKITGAILGKLFTDTIKP